MVSEPLLCRSGCGANFIKDDESLIGVFVTPLANPISAMDMSDSRFISKYFGLPKNNAFWGHMYDKFLELCS